MTQPRPVVIAGVSGTGKTTVGQVVAERSVRPFLDADDLHSNAAVATMAAGVPLTDADRWPWLDDVAAWLRDHPEGVCACSALSRAHRDRLRAGAPDVRVIMLAAPPEVLAERLRTRTGHFMPAALLDSQFAAYEPIRREARADTVDVTGPIDQVVLQVLELLASPLKGQAGA